MNNEEILKIKELKKAKNKIRGEMDQIRNILNNYRNAFKYQESIGAIERIHAYFCKQYNRCQELNKEIEDIAKLLKENCNHHVLIRYFLTHECPICKMTYKYSNEFPNTTEYVISDFDYDKEIDTIDGFVLSSNNEQTIDNQILNHFNNLQYSQNVKIRRIKK